MKALAPWVGRPGSPWPSPMFHEHAGPRAGHGVPVVPGHHRGAGAHFTEGAAALSGLEGICPGGEQTLAPRCSPAPRREPARGSHRLSLFPSTLGPRGGPWQGFLSWVGPS